MTPRVVFSASVTLVLVGCATPPPPPSDPPPPRCPTFEAAWYISETPAQSANAGVPPTAAASAIAPKLHVAVTHSGPDAVLAKAILVNPVGRQRQGWSLNAPGEPWAPGWLVVRRIDEDTKHDDGVRGFGHCWVPVRLLVLANCEGGERELVASLSGRLPNFLPESWLSCFEEQR